MAEECGDARLERCRAFMSAPPSRLFSVLNFGVPSLLGSGNQGQRHATDVDVDSGRVRLEDKHGNAEADDAADLGRRHQPGLLVDTWRALLNARSHWYPTMHQLHRFMIAISRVTVNHDGRGGSAPDPLVWDHGGRRKQRRTDTRVNVDLPSLPEPPGFLSGPRVQVNCGCITGSDVASWSYSVSILCFLDTLHWPAGEADSGHFGVSFLEVLILFEQRTSHRLIV